MTPRTAVARMQWMPDYRRLRVCKLAEELSADVHELIARFPSRKAPGLVAQVRSSVQSPKVQAIRVKRS